MELNLRKAQERDLDGLDQVMLVIEELEQASHALEVLGGTQVQVRSFTLPTAGERNILLVRKTKFTPKGYPRHGSTIAKHPL